MFKPCIYLIVTRTQIIAFCLEYREWINTCPSKCGYFEEGEVGTHEEVVGKKYNIDCHYFTRIKSGEKVNYYCKLLEQNEPYCDMCLYAKTTP